MGTKYPGVSISGYNTAPPPDDGSQTLSNKVTWNASIKSKLADPLKNLAQAINTALVNVLNLASRSVVASTEAALSDHWRTLEVSGSSITITLPDAATAGSGYVVCVKAMTANVTIGRHTGADTIDGTAANTTVTTGNAKTFLVNAAQNGYITIAGAAGATTHIGHATTSNGKDFTVTFDNTISLTKGTTCTVIFDANQTVDNPTLNGDGTGAVTMKNRSSREDIQAYRILAHDVLQVVYDGDDNVWVVTDLVPLLEFYIAAADQVSVITTGTKFTFPAWPYDIRIIETQNAVVTESSSGAITFNVKDGGTTIYSTTPTIDQGELSTQTAATPAVISDRIILKGAVVTLTIDGAGTNAIGPSWYIAARKAESQLLTIFVSDSVTTSESKNVTRV